MDLPTPALQRAKLKVLVWAYACEPGLGSEIGVGWHWVQEMAREFQVWVLTRASNRQRIEAFHAQHPDAPRPTYIYHDLPAWARRWKRGMRGVRLYYLLWTATAEKIVRRTLREQQIDVFHHLTYGNALWPVSRAGSRRCFVWGPLSAGTCLPPDFTRRLTLAARIKEALQRLMARALPLDPFFRRRCRRAQLILCKTDATREHVPPEARSRAVQMTDVAVGEISVESTEILSRQTPFTFLAVGTLVGWRGLDILVEAFARVSQKAAPVKLLIVGEGPEEAHLRRLIEGAREGSVELLGSRTPAEVHQLMDRADAFVNPCQREGAVTVSFDAIAHSRPIICFDTGGYTHAFRPTFANVLPPCATRQEATRRLEEALLQMADRQRAHQMGQSARQAAAELTWERKGERIRELIRKAYDDAQR